jgi:hypothetical protein
MVVPIVIERWVGYSQCKQKMMSFREQARWAKMMSPGGKLTSVACHLTKIVNKAEEPTYPSLNIEFCFHAHYRLACLQTQNKNVYELKWVSLACSLAGLGSQNVVGLLNKCSHLAAALGMTKFMTGIAINLVTLCCAS